MIKLDNQFQIDADTYGWTLYSITKAKDEDKKDRRSVIGYYLSLEETLKEYVNYCVRKAVEREEIKTIKEVMKMVEDLNLKIGEVCKGV